MPEAAATETDNTYDVFQSSASEESAESGLSEAEPRGKSNGKKPKAKPEPKSAKKQPGPVLCGRDALFWALYQLQLFWTVKNPIRLLPDASLLRSEWKQHRNAAEQMRAFERYLEIFEGQVFVRLSSTTPTARVEQDQYRSAYDCLRACLLLSLEQGITKFPQEASDFDCFFRLRTMLLEQGIETTLANKSSEAQERILDSWSLSSQQLDVLGRTDATILMLVRQAVDVYAVVLCWKSSGALTVLRLELSGMLLNLVLQFLAGDEPNLGLFLPNLECWVLTSPSSKSLANDAVNSVASHDEVLCMGLFEGRVSYSEEELQAQNGTPLSMGQTHLLSLPFPAGSNIDSASLLRFLAFTKVWVGSLPASTRHSPTMLQIASQDSIQDVLRENIATRFFGYLERLPRKQDWRLEMHEMAILEARVEAVALPWLHDYSRILCLFDFVPGQTLFSMLSQEGLLLASCRVPDNSRRYVVFGLVVFPSGGAKYVPLPSSTQCTTQRGVKLWPFRIHLGTGEKTPLSQTDLDLPPEAQRSVSMMGRELFRDAPEMIQIPSATSTTRRKTRSGARSSKR
ncbi:hypothetical protein EBZ37_07840 [bacterium]|nr:hypothetical protein [bacterium]